MVQRIAGNEVSTTCGSGVGDSLSRGSHATLSILQPSISTHPLPQVVLTSSSAARVRVPLDQKGLADHQIR
jgi:hypothetical protein